MTWGKKQPIATPQAPVFENEHSLKLAFAAALLKTPNDPFKAALTVINGSTHFAHAMWAAQNWPNDPTVRNEQDRLTAEEGELAFLPSKAQIAREMYELAQREKLSQSDKLKLEALNAYAELMGFVSKGAKAGVSVNANQGASVQVVASELDEKL